MLSSFLFSKQWCDAKTKMKKMGSGFPLTSLKEVFYLQGKRNSVNFAVQTNQRKQQITTNTCMLTRAQGISCCLQSSHILFSIPINIDFICIFTRTTFSKNKSKGVENVLKLWAISFQWCASTYCRSINLEPLIHFICFLCCIITKCPIDSI